MSDELPQGWSIVELENHVYIAGRIGWRGLKRSEYTKTGPRFLAVRNILPNGQIDFNETDHLSQERYDESPEIQLKQNDILLTKDGTIGKVGMIDSLPTPTSVNSSILVLRPNDELLVDRYLFHYLRGPQFQEIAHERITGSAIPHLFQKDIKKLRALVPPIDEQRRIVAKLEKLLPKVDTCQQRLAKIPVLLKRFRQSVLAAACSGKLTTDWREKNPEVEPAAQILEQIGKERKRLKLRKSKRSVEVELLGIPFEVPATWSLCLFDDLAAAKPNAIKAGPFGSSLTKACYVRSGFKVYGQEQVIHGDPNFGDYYIGEGKFRELQTCEVSAGDILVSLVGTIGKVLVIPKRFQPGIINPRLAKFSLHPSIVREYIANYLLSSLAKNILSQQSHGGTMEILNLGMMRALPIPLPPLPEQQEIVRRVEALFALADQIDARYAKAKAYVEKLTPSLLALAFRGELVLQDPNDEPASVLLERIKQTKPNEQPKRKGKRAALASV